MMKKYELQHNNVNANKAAQPQNNISQDLLENLRNNFLPRHKANVHQLTNRSEKLGEAIDKISQALNKLSSAKNPGNTVLDQRSIASALGDMGYVYKSNNKYAEAIAAYNEGIKIYKGLVTNDPNDAKYYQKIIALGLDKIGEIYKSQNKYEEAKAAYYEGIKIYEGLITNDPDDAKYYQGRITYTLGLIGDIFSLIGDVYKSQNKYEEAIAAYNGKMTIYKGLVGNDPNYAKYYQGTIAHTLSHKGEIFSLIGDVYKSQNKYEEAIAAYNEKMTIYKGLIENDPEGTASYQVIVESTLDKIGDVYKSQNKYEEAIAAYNGKVEMYKWLVGNDSKNAARYNGRIADILSQIGDVYKSQNKYEEAIAAYREIVQMYQNLITNDPKNTANDQAKVEDTLNKIGDVYKSQNKYEEAIATYRGKVLMYEFLVESNPDGAVGYREKIARTLGDIGDIYQSQNKHEEALKEYNAKVAIYQWLIKNDPKNTAFYQKDNAYTLGKIGDIYQSQNQYEEAIAAYKQMVEIYKGLIKNDPKNTAFYQKDNAYTLGNVGDIFGKIGDIYKSQNEYEKAIAAYREKVQMYEFLVEKNPDGAVGYREEIALTLDNVGDIYQSQNQYEEAIAAYYEKVKMYEVLVTNDPEHTVFYQIMRALTLGDIGDIYKSQNKQAEALKAYKEAVKMYKELVENDKQAVKMYKELIENDPACYQNMIACTLNKIGDIYESQKNQGEAFEAHREALKIYREAAKIYHKFIEKEPENAAYYQRMIARTVSKYQGIGQSQNQYERVIVVYNEEVGIYEQLTENDSGYGIDESQNQYEEVETNRVMERPVEKMSNAPQLFKNQLVEQEALIPSQQNSFPVQQLPDAVQQLANYIVSIAKNCYINDDDSKLDKLKKEYKDDKLGLEVLTKAAELQNKWNDTLELKNIDMTTVEKILLNFTLDVENLKALMSIMSNILKAKTSIWNTVLNKSHPIEQWLNEKILLFIDNNLKFWEALLQQYSTTENGVMVDFIGLECLKMYSQARELMRSSHSKLLQQKLQQKVTEHSELYRDIFAKYNQAIEDNREEVHNNQLHFEDGEDEEKQSPYEKALDRIDFLEQAWHMVENDVTSLLDFKALSALAEVFPQVTEGGQLQLKKEVQKIVQKNLDLCLKFIELLKTLEPNIPDDMVRDMQKVKNNIGKLDQELSKNKYAALGIMENPKIQESFGTLRTFAELPDPTASADSIFSRGFNIVKNMSSVLRNQNLKGNEDEQPPYEKALEHVKSMKNKWGMQQDASAPIDFKELNDLAKVFPQVTEEGQLQLKKEVQTIVQEKLNLHIKSIDTLKELRLDNDDNDIEEEIAEQAQQLKNNIGELYKELNQRKYAALGIMQRDDIKASFDALHTFAELSDQTASKKSILTQSTDILKGAGSSILGKAGSLFGGFAKKTLGNNNKNINVMFNPPEHQTILANIIQERDFAKMNYYSSKEDIGIASHEQFTDRILLKNPDDSINKLVLNIVRHYTLFESALQENTTSEDVTASTLGRKLIHNLQDVASYSGTNGIATRTQEVLYDNILEATRNGITALSHANQLTHEHLLKIMTSLETMSEEIGYNAIDLLRESLLRRVNDNGVVIGTSLTNADDIDLVTTFLTDKGCIDCAETLEAGYANQCGNIASEDNDIIQIIKFAPIRFDHEFMRQHIAIFPNIVIGTDAGDITTDNMPHVYDVIHDMNEMTILAEHHILNSMTHHI